GEQQHILPLLDAALIHRTQRYTQLLAADVGNGVLRVVCVGPGTVGRGRLFAGKRAVGVETERGRLCRRRPVVGVAPFIAGRLRVGRVAHDVVMDGLLLGDGVVLAQE